MRVAVDARALAGPRSGLFVYTESILAAMQKAAPETEWTLYSHRPVHAPELSGERVVLRFPDSTLLRPSWLRARLVPALRRRRPDVWFSPLSAALAARDCPSVAVVHDLAMLRFPKIMPAHYRWSWTRTLAAATTRASRLIAVSQSTRRDLVQLLGVDDRRIRVIYEAADECFFQPMAQTTVAETLQALCRREGAELSPGYLLYPATLEPRKNHLTLLRAYVELCMEKKARRPLVLVGGKGWGDKRKVLSILREPPDGPGLHWITGADREELRALYAGARMMVFPSRYEGFGLPVVEAMAAGVPVVASNVSSLPEVLGDAGLLLPADDVNAWKTAVRDLPDDDARLAAMREAGLARARNFSWDKAAEATLSLLREAAR
ncbi:glycosyltransferase family 4 protein [bacterium]|nr:glycosyltransferase family 4 protein [bacterium]